MVIPRADLIDLALPRVGWSFKESWPGTHARLLAAQPWRSWYPKFASFEQVIKWSPHSDLFIDRSGGRPHKVPNEENVDWVALRISKCA